MRNIVLLLALELAAGLRRKKVDPQAELNRNVMREEEQKGRVLGMMLDGCEFGKGCPNSKAPSVAVCVAGLANSFPHPQQVQSIKSMLLQPIKEAGAIGLNRSEPDVFVHTKEGAYPTIAKAREQAAHHVSNTKENILAAAKDIGAVDVVVEEGWGKAHDRSVLANPSCFHPRNPSHTIESIMSYHYDIHGCLEQLKKVEQKIGKQYDFVIQLRPDTVEIDPSPAKIIKAIQCEKSMYVRDAVSYSTRAGFEVYGNLWINQFQNPNPSMCKETGSAEKYPESAAADMNSKGMHAAYVR